MRTFHLITFLLISFNVTAQLNIPPVKGAIQVDPVYDTCYAYISDVKSHIENTNPRFKLFRELYNSDKTAARSFQNSLATSKILINFSENFNDFPSAKQAFRFAADMWEMELVSSVPIVINADIQDLGANTIGQNASNRVVKVPNAPDPTLVYVTSLANAIAGVDLLPGQPDLFQTYNSAFNFYYGTDGNPPSNKTDFVTIAFHEIGHGLGITGSSNSGNGVGLDFGRSPMAWDFFVELGSGISILDLGFSTDEQKEAFISNDLFIDSYHSVKALNGNRPQIFAPTNFNAGSSYSHWDENAFPPGSPNSLMTPFNATGESIHDPGDITRGILRDMGWKLAPKFEFDLGIARISAPTSKLNLAQESVTVVLGNRGTKGVSNVKVSYRIDGGSWVTETFQGLLNPMQEVTYTFSQKADLSTPGKTYTMEAKVDYFIDENKDNNQATINVTHLLPISTFPYAESFEGENSGWTVAEDQVWELGVPSDSIINSASDGERAWVTRLSSNYPNESTSFLLSPVFNFSNKQDPIVEFDLWYDIEFGWDGAALQVSYNDGTSWQTVGEYNDPNNWYTDGEARTAAADKSEGVDGIDALLAAVGNGNGWTGMSSGWITARHTITGAGEKENVRLRFVFASDQALNMEGIAIDNFKIYAPEIVENDVGITQILSPKTGNLSSAESVKVIVKNFGTTAASGFELTYQVNDGGIVTEAYSQTLNIGAVDTVTFSTTTDLAANQVYTLRSFTTYSVDQNLINDTAKVVIESILTIASFPYQESFESGKAGWSVSGDSASWELEVPNGSIIDTASAGVLAWVTNATGNYKNNERSYLNSPGFDFTNVQLPRLAFDLWFETEELKDGLFLQYSLDKGKNWNILEPGISGSANIYNTGGLNAPGNPEGFAWTGSSSGYQTVLFNLNDLVGESFVLFRYFFISDNQLNNEGVAIDNVRIFDSANIDFTITCPSNKEANNDSFLNTAFVNVSNPTVSSASGTVTYSNTFTNSSDASGNYPIGTTNVIFIVDVEGEVRTCSTTITVIDNEAPTIICPDNKIVAVTPGATGAEVTYNLPRVADNYGFLNQVTYTNDQTVDGQSGIACPTGPNSFIRVFELEEDFEITEDFDVKSVDVGVQVVNEGDVHAEGNKVPAKINLYLFDSKTFSKDDPAEFVFNNMTLLKSQDFALDIGLENVIVNVPVEATVPAGYSVVVEFFTQAGSDQIFPGANPNQTGDSYIVAPNCGISQPFSVSHPDLNFPESQWIINVNGLRKSNVVPELIAGKLSGSIFPLGTTSNQYRIEDISGFFATCSFDVKVVEAQLEAPTNLTVTNTTSNSFTVNWDPVTGVNHYQVVISTDNFTSFVDQYNEVIVSGTSFNATGLKPNKAYFVKVRSVNDNTNPTAYSVYSSTLITSTDITTPIVSEPIFVTDDQFKFSWTSIENINKYEVDISTDNFSTFVSGYNNKVVEGNDLIAEGLESNTLYYYRVRAVNEGGKSAFSNVETAITLPSIPNPFPASDIDSTSFVANWNAVPEAEYYLLDVSTDNFKTFVEGYDSLQVNGTSHEVTGLQSNTNYQYRVRAFNSLGGKSLNSHIIRVTTHAKIPVALQPDVVTDFGAVAQWKPTNVKTYEIDLSADNFSSYLVKALPVEDTAKTIFELEPNTTYNYRVRSVNRKGVVSQSSNVITFTTNAAALEAPIATDATEVGNFSFTANWNDLSGALYYQLQISDDNFATILDEFQIFGNSFEVTGLEDDKTYYYRVKAFNNESSSSFSNVIQVNTILGIEDEIKGLTYYPNPVKELLNIRSSENDLEYLEVFSISGQKQTPEVRKNSNSFTVIMSDLPNGIYLVKLRSKKGSVATIKVIKQ